MDVYDGAKTIAEPTIDAYESDFAICWTLWRGHKRRRIADRHTEMGKPVICMENSWYPNYYQCVLRKDSTECSGVNGAGLYPTDRRFVFSFKKWHQGDEILVCPQRGVTPNDPDISHGMDWVNSIVGRIRQHSERPIKWKANPKHPCVPKDTSDIEIVDRIPENPWCCVVYSSLIAVPLLQTGTPIIADGPQTMYRELSGNLCDIENPPMLNRTKHFNRMMNQLWHSSDIKRGIAFKTLLEYHDKSKSVV